MYGRSPYSSIPYSSVEVPALESPVVPPVWENPRGPQYPSILRTYTDSFNLPMQQVLPPRQTDWPVPIGPQFPIVLRTWIKYSLPTEPLPKNTAYYDWPVPIGPQYPISLRTWIDSFKLGLQSILPENQYSWPNPSLGSPFPIVLRTHVKTSLPIPIPAPPQQNPPPFPTTFNTALPTLARRPVVSLLTWTWSDVRYIGTGQPHRQRDWPNPVRAKPDPNRYIMTVAGNKPQYPPTPAGPATQMLGRLEPRVRYLKNEVGRVRFLAKTVIE